MSPEPDPGTEDSVSVREWVERRMPVADLASTSEPEPVLLRHNAVAIARDPDAARSVVLAWERILPEDRAVGFLARGTSPEQRDVSGRADAAGVTGHAAARVVRGGVPGAVLGAFVVAVAVWIMEGSTTVLIGALLGGAAFGFVAGGMISFATGTGWGAAYRDSFVDEEQTDLLVVSIHSDDEAPIAEAADAVSGVEAVELFFVDRTGGSSRLR
ncbi:MAG: hypothetical protein R8G01_17450 [Ilumatobacteraceae bacterium]|nr:hypothetical protein [Ilumatobacteraceae bacterium]